MRWSGERETQWENNILRLISNGFHVHKTSLSHGNSLETWHFATDRYICSISIIVFPKNIFTKISLTIFYIYMENFRRQPLCTTKTSVFHESMRNNLTVTATMIRFPFYPSRSDHLESVQFVARNMIANRAQVAISWRRWQTSSLIFSASFEYNQRTFLRKSRHSHREKSTLRTCRRSKWIRSSNYVRKLDQF